MIRHYFTLAIALFLLVYQPAAQSNCRDNSAPDSQQAIAAIGHGINLGYALEQCFKYPALSYQKRCKSEPNTQPYSPTNYVQLLLTDAFWEQSYIRRANSVRLPVDWWQYKDPKTDTTVINPVYLGLVREVIDKALKKRDDLVVIVDLHEINKEIAKIKPDSSADPLPGFKDLQEIWMQVANALNDYPPGCVFFDLLNEPQRENKRRNLRNYCSKDIEWPAHVKNLVEKIRETSGNNAKRPLIIAACNPDDYRDIDTVLGPIFKDLRAKPGMEPLLATFHYYDPYWATSWRDRCAPNKDKGSSGCPGNADRSAPYPLAKAPSELRKPGRKVMPGDDTLWKRNIETAFSKVAKFSNTNNIPVWLGEFGFERYVKGVPFPLTSSEKKQLCSDRRAWVKAVVEQATKFGMAYSYWNAFGSFGLAGTDGKLNDPVIEDILFGLYLNAERTPECF